VKNITCRIILILLLIGLPITSLSCKNTASKNTYKNIYFTQWDGYAGYMLQEGTGLLQIPYLDFNPDRTFFSSAIKDLAIISDNPIVKVDSFRIIDGSKSKVFDVKTLNIQLDLVKTGTANISGINILLNDGSRIKWNIGNLKLDILNGRSSYPLELGIREVELATPSFYKFTISNVSKSQIQIQGLIYDNNDLDFDKMSVSSQYHGSVDTPTSNIENYLLLPNQTKVFNYFVNQQKRGPAKFVFIKPFLKYQINGKDYLYPLDSMIYSSTFTPDIVSNIKMTGQAIVQ
jgi:hypothetical protein